MKNTTISQVENGYVVYINEENTDKEIGYVFTTLSDTIEFVKNNFIEVKE